MHNVINIISECKDMGIMFSIDDFGTGYSSLSYLKLLPVTVLKVDQSFVNNMLYDVDDLAILEGILGLGIAFRQEVIAEGVGTIEHGKILLNIGYELAQGYAISKPMKAELYLEWSNSWKPDSEWTSSLPFQKNNMELLHVAVEHNAWIKRLEEFLLDTQNILSEPSIHECHLERWLDSNAITLSTRLSYINVTTLHSNLHILTHKLLELKKNGANSEIFENLPEFRNIKKELNEQIINLANG
jgi:hypothetical protein